MKFSWLFNGTLEAHHLAAAYLMVWMVQGGYACWIAWQWVRVRRESRAVVPEGSSARDRY